MTSLHFTAIIEIYNGNPYVLVDEMKAKKLKSDWKKADASAGTNK